LLYFEKGTGGFKFFLFSDINLYRRKFQMTVLTGKGVGGGIAIGKLQFYRHNGTEVNKDHIKDTTAEIRRFHEAKQREIKELDQLYEKALHEAGEAEARIFQIHQMMLEDDDFCQSVIEIIRTENVNAEYAVNTTAGHMAQLISNVDDEYLKQRSADVVGVFTELVNMLTGTTVFNDYEEPIILAADDLAPGETVRLDKSKVLALVTIHGSLNSHTAILARSMNIPSIVALGDCLKPEFEGKGVIVDGTAGKMYLDPDAATLEIFKATDEKEKAEYQRLLGLKGKEDVTLDGKRIKVYANVGCLADVETALLNDAGGIGLFRSEFLYLGRHTYPTEEEQYQIYKAAAERMGGKEVIIRTLDIGADKQADYFHLPKEENPALGYRAIRICLRRTEIFRTQLRALYRAAACGAVAVMFPMITSLEEVRQCKEIARDICRELAEEGSDYNHDLKMGIMIETPAAALISDKLAGEVDFFSIGTNDLTQYTLAVDRQNSNLESFYNPRHEAVLKLIKITVENAHRQGIQVGVCGELGADLSLTQTFLNMGLDEISVAPSSVLPLRKAIRECYSFAV
jgi:phosphotransferase system enzyme I (PtsI)